MILNKIEFQENSFRGEPQFVGEFELGNKYVIIGEWFLGRNNEEEDYCILKLFKVIDNKAFFQRIICKHCWYNDDYINDIIEVDKIGFGGSIWVHVNNRRNGKKEKIGVLRRW